MYKMSKERIRFCKEITQEEERTQELKGLERPERYEYAQLNKTYYSDWEEVIWCLVECDKTPQLGWQVIGLPKDYQWVKDGAPTVKHIVYSCDRGGVTIYLM